MSDQSKIRRGEPKPATGEWTNVDVEELWEKGGSIAVKDAHNAALAAEQERCRLALLDCSVKNTDLAMALNSCERKLSADREKWIKLCDKASDNATKAEQQLAAAYQKGWDDHYNERIQQGEYGS